MKNLALSSSLAVIMAALFISAAGAQGMASDPALDRKVMDSLGECQRVSVSCAETTKDAMGVLVFPAVLQADLLIGGAGGKGALVENGLITGYYSIGAASAGLQAGIKSGSQVYVFRTAEALAALKDSPNWNVGTTAGLTLMTADATARGQAGEVAVYVFDSSGLHGGVALDVFNVWKTEARRP